MDTQPLISVITAAINGDWNAFVQNFGTSLCWPNCLTFSHSGRLLFPFSNCNCAHLSSVRGCCVLHLLLFTHSKRGDCHWPSVKLLACICSGSGLAAIRSQRRNRCCRVGANVLRVSIGRRKQEVQTQSITVELWLMFQLNVCRRHERNTIDLKLCVVGEPFFCLFIEFVFFPLISSS